MTKHTLPKVYFAGFRSKWRLFLSILIISSIISTLSYLILKDTLETTTEHQALVLADIIARQAAAARSVYSDIVISKLERDGFGAHKDSDTVLGHVPLSSQFLKLMGHRSSISNSALFRYKQISKWHLEPTQGLNDDFENWAWQQLEAQDQANPSGPIDWQAAWWTEDWQGQRFFRYLRADPAYDQTCVSCHNQNLRQDNIKAQLKTDGIYTLKQFKQHQLMGGISVTISLSKLEHVALDDLRQTIVWTATFIVTALIIIGGTIISNTHPNSGSQKLSWEETHEQETGLLSLTGMEQTLSSAIDVAKQEGLKHSFICLKLEDTHNIKESHGSEIYGKLRANFSENIKKSLRHNDSLGWLSHDKLGVLILDCSTEYAKNIIEQLRKTIQDTETALNGEVININAIISLTMITRNTLSVSNIIKSTDRIDHEAVSTSA